MSEPKLKAGDRVKLTKSPPYFKTAEPMPMLRPPETVALGEQGIVLDQRPGGYWAVRFPRGSFLIDPDWIEPIESG